MRRSIEPRKKSEGFVFLEVLIAAAILSTACLHLSRALHASLNSAKKMRNAYRAALAIDRFLWEWDRAGSDLRNLNPEAPALKGWSWEVREPELIGNGALLRQKIEVRQESREGGEQSWEVVHYAAAR